MEAYDYKAQRWVTGEEARKLIAQQESERARALQNPEFRKFIAKRAAK